MKARCNRDSDYARLKRALKTDNAPSQDFLTILYRDVDVLLRSYLVYAEGDLSVEANAADGGIDVCIKCRARSHKPIKVL